MQVLPVIYGEPIWLPGDKGDLTPVGTPLPFTSTLASPAIFTIPGYQPVAGDKMTLTPGATGALPSGATSGATYFVIATGLSVEAFELSATAAGTGINGAAAGAGNAHISKEQTSEIPLLFKPGNDCICLNLSGGTLILQGASDIGTQPQAPQGAGSYSTILSLGANSMGKVNLKYDWLTVNASGTLYLLSD